MVEDSTQPTEQSSSSAEHITEEEVFYQLIEDEKRVLVDFYADWCGPCQLMAPTVDELASESDAAIVKLDVEALPQIAIQYDVSSIPAFIAFKDGTIEKRLVGMQNKTNLAQIIE